MKMRHVGKNRGAFGKKRRDTLPSQIQRQTIKVWHVSYQKARHKFLISAVLFLHMCISTELRIKYFCFISA